MSADEIVLTADSTHALDDHLAVTTKRGQPVFLIALFGAAAVHAALIAGMIGSPPRYIGDPDGSSRVINVELIDEAEFQNMSPSTSRPGNPPSVAATPALRPQPQTPRPSKSDLSQEPAKQPSLDPTKSKAPAPQDSSEKRKVTEIVPNYELKPPPPLDLRVPFNAVTSGAQGSSSGATRPPGITRSGENDKFGREVIRSLRKTMPPPSDIKGRVTIRIFLDEKGNIARAELVQSGGNAELDQSVLYSAQQATFPYPPNGATVADRTFRVTYIYK
jgi:TonB family protein